MPEGAFRSACAGALCALLAWFALATGASGADRHRALYRDAAVFTQAIEAARPDHVLNPPASGRTVTGITVPHHLLAADLIARGFWQAAGRGYERIVVLLPDHFKASPAPFATTRRGFETPFGPVDCDMDAVQGLLDEGGPVAESDLFAREHGLHAVLPFIRHFFPDAAIVPLAISPAAKRRDWDRLAERLKPLLDAQTLIVQSTDFSHYLPMANALLRDQEVLNTLASESLDAVAALRPVAHMDSIGAQYIQMRLQREVFGAELFVIANANSQGYTDTVLAETTSYIVQVFLADEGAGPVLDDIAEQTVFYFAGDTLLGRNLTHLLADRAIQDEVAERILAITRYRPIVLNLEGVVLEEVPESMRLSSLTMPATIAVGWLHRLGVAAVSLANNHSRDMGPEAFAEMRQLLEDLEIKVLSDGEIIDLGPFRAVALTDFRNANPPGGNLIIAEVLDELLDPAARPPVIAFVHWGREGDSQAGTRERELSHELRQRGVSAIIGSHSHRASTAIVPLAGGQALRVYSLGNFIFDQTAEVASGALLEVRFFEQGTFFARLIPIPNYYDHMRSLRRTGAP